MPSRLFRFLGFVLIVSLSLSNALAQERSIGTAEDIKFFEKEVLPILKANCFACHGSEKKLQGGLKLISREDILKGGESGPSVDRRPFRKRPAIDQRGTRQHPSKTAAIR